jgi:hypothetical protein
LAGIYLEDEMPDMGTIAKFSEEDRNQVFRLFGIRMKIWDQEALEKEDQQFRDTARSQIPNYALFQRLELSAKDRKAQETVFQETVEGLHSWFSRADKAEISEDKHGTNFSVTYDLTKGKYAAAKKLPWWKRVTLATWPRLTSASLASSCIFQERIGAANS